MLTELEGVSVLPVCQSDTEIDTAIARFGHRWRTRCSHSQMSLLRVSSNTAGSLPHVKEHGACSHFLPFYPSTSKSALFQDVASVVVDQ